MEDTLGKRIKRARGKRTLRQTALAAQISPTFLSNVENEISTGTPSEETLKRLATILDEDIDELLRLAGRVPQDVQKLLLDKKGRFEQVRKLYE